MYQCTRSVVNPTVLLLDVFSVCYVKTKIELEFSGMFNVNKNTSERMSFTFIPQLDIITPYKLHSKHQDT